MNLRGQSWVSSCPAPGSARGCERSPAPPNADPFVVQPPPPPPPLPPLVTPVATCMALAFPSFQASVCSTQQMPLNMALQQEALGRCGSLAGWSRPVVHQSLRVNGCTSPHFKSSRYQRAASGWRSLMMGPCCTPSSCMMYSTFSRSGVV